ncbi:restriction endonuclease [Corynebacterium freneyi]|nr:restriction endonuclease [Corynebacterium freneyi]
MLEVLADGRERSSREICEAVADAMELPDEVRSARIASGQQRYVNRINWALSGSVMGGLLVRPRRGYYQITDDGLTVHRRNLPTYSEKDMLEWPTWREYQEEIAARNRAKKSGTHDDPNAPSPRSTQDVGSADVAPADPIETMEAAENAFNANTETQLRKRLQASSPEFFEKAVIDVLWAMGYGGAHGEKQHVGRTGDGGIDGIIRQDALGLSNIYVQAKRYADTNRVGVSEMRNFIGALDSRGANLGVFITTSTFLPATQDTAKNYRHGRIVLIDGLKLTELMLTYGVAVHKSREFTLYEIDDDFFDDDLA